MELELSEEQATEVEEYIVSLLENLEFVGGLSVKGNFYYFNTRIVPKKMIVIENSFFEVVHFSQEGKSCYVKLKINAIFVDGEIERQEKEKQP